MSPLRCVWGGKTHTQKTHVLFLGFGHTQHSAWFFRCNPEIGLILRSFATWLLRLVHYFKSVCWEEGLLGRLPRQQSRKTKDNCPCTWEIRHCQPKWTMWLHGLQANPAGGSAGNQHARTESKCWFVSTVKELIYYVCVPFAFISRLVLVEHRWRVWSFMSGL